MVFFRASSIGEGISILKHLFIFNGNITLAFMSIADYIIIIISLLALILVDNKWDKIKDKLNKSLELRIVLMGSLILIVLLFGMYGLNFVADDFIYGNF